MLSKKAKYALKAMLYLAREQKSEAVLISQIADEEHIPKKFLESILLSLKHAGLCLSRKGRGGGYSLARPAAAISFGEIVRNMDGPLAPVSCVSVTAYHPCAECGDQGACEVRLVMKKARDAIANVLDSTSLAEAVRQGERLRRRPRRR